MTMPIILLGTQIRDASYKEWEQTICVDSNSQPQWRKAKFNSWLKQKEALSVNTHVTKEEEG